MLKIALIGQSTMSNWWELSDGSCPTPLAGTSARYCYGPHSGTVSDVVGNGAVTFANAIKTATGQDVRLICAALGNTCFDPVWLPGCAGCWTLPSTGSPMDLFWHALDADGRTPDAILVHHGQTDMAGTSRADYFADALVVRDLALARCLFVPSMPYMVGVVSRGFAGAAAVDGVRAGTLDMIAMPGVLRGPAVHDLPTQPDGVHLTVAGYAAMGARFSLALAPVLAGQPPAPGPFITGAMRVSDRVVRLSVTNTTSALRSAWTTAPAGDQSRATGFRFFDATGTEFGLWYVGAVTATELVAINVAGGEAPAAAVSYLEGNAFDATNLLFDAAGMPLQPTAWRMPIV